MNNQIVRCMAEKLYLGMSENDPIIKENKNRLEDQVFLIFLRGFEMGYDIGLEKGILDSIDDDPERN